MQLPQEELYATRSEEVQEILGKPPTFLMRWGIPMLFVIFVGTVLLAHFIRYPDTAEMLCSRLGGINATTLHKEINYFPNFILILMYIGGIYATFQEGIDRT